MTPAERIRVWDLPTRVFHWTLVVLVGFSFATGKVGGTWLEWHMKSGYAILTLLVFRVAWGFVGSDTARFHRFLRGPRAGLGYARDLFAARHVSSIGHNPLGGWMVVFMLVLLLAQASTGLFVDDEIYTQGPLTGKVSGAAVGKMTAFHHYNQWAIAGAVLLHVLAISYYRLRLATDLVGPMVSGWMVVPPGVRSPAPGHRSPLLALALLAAAAAFVYWLVAIYPKG